MTQLRIPYPLLQRIYRQADREFPRECCGILVGTGGKIKAVETIFPAVNAERLQGGDRYRINGKDFLRVDREARETGREILGFYHSHPASPSLPSSVDLQRAWSQYSYLIVSVRTGEEPTSRSWVLKPQETSFCEEKLMIIPGEPCRKGSLA